MTHPLTPREKVAAFLKERDEACGVIDADDAERDESAGLVLTALASGSGDHAELADRLMNVSLRWKDADQEREEASRAITALIAESAALRGELDHVRSLHNRATDRSRHWEIASINADNRATEAERELSEHRITADLLVSTLKADKAEAERKLAEAVGLKHLTDGQIFAAINAAVTITRDRNGVDNGAVCISPEKFRTFLSKEAERG